MFKTQYLLIVLFLCQVSKGNGRNFGEMEREDVNITEGNTKNSVTDKNDPQFSIGKINDTDIEENSLSRENSANISKTFDNSTQISVNEKNNIIFDVLINSIEHGLKGGNGIQTTKNDSYIDIIKENITHTVYVIAKNDTYNKNLISNQGEDENNSEIEENPIKNYMIEENDTNTKYKESYKFPPSFKIAMNARKFKKKYLKLFEEYKKRYSKTYSSVKENKKRFNIFRKNMKKIENQKNKKSNITVFNIGFLDDLTVKEKYQYLRKTLSHHRHKSKLHRLQ